MRRFQRRHAFRDPKKFFIIATEGECTEEIYFKELRPPRGAVIQLKVLPTKKGKSDPKKVFARLQSYESEFGAGKLDELWLVIDRDFWTEPMLNEIARAVTARPNYNLAMSNPCFELWLVLHLQDASNETCEELQDILAKALGSYTKNSYGVERLKPGIAAAVKRARKMDTTSQELWPRKPGTHVYKLVEKLLQH